MIARQLAIAGLIYLALMIQPSLGAGLDKLSYCPWLPALAVLACVGLSTGVPCVIWSGLLGLGVDCLSGGKLGIHLIAATIFACALLTLKSSGRSHVFFSGSLTFFGTSIWRSLPAIAHAPVSDQAFDLLQCIIPACREGLATAVLLVGILVTCRALTSAVRPHPNSSVSLSNRWSMLTGG